VNLVDDLSAPQQPHAAAAAPPAAARLPMVEYCGFFSLDEARRARGRLQTEQLHADILIRQAEPPVGGDSGDEEYWLRVEAAQYKRATAILGYDAAENDGSDDRFD